MKEKRTPEKNKYNNKEPASSSNSSSYRTALSAMDIDDGRDRPEDAECSDLEDLIELSSSA